MEASRRSQRLVNWYYLSEGWRHSVLDTQTQQVDWFRVRFHYEIVDAVAEVGSDQQLVTRLSSTSLTENPQRTMISLHLAPN